MSRLLNLKQVPVLICFGLTATLSGCSALDFSKPTSAAINDVHGLADDEFSLSVVGSDEPNDILVAISVPSAFVSRCLIRRTTKSDRKSVLIDIVNGGKFSDGSLKPKETYLYELGHIESGQFKTESSLTVTIPEDFVIRGEVTLPFVTTMEFSPYRIFIRPGGTLITNGQSLSIITNEIISENGTIETFNPNSPAAAGTRGRSGGTLKIRTPKVTGHLNIVMRGETGATGVPGMPGAEGSGSGDTIPTNGQPGGQGSPGGNSGVLHLSVPDLKAVTVSVVAGLGGAGGPGGKNGEGYGGGYAPNGPLGYDGQTDPQNEDWK